MPIHETAQFKGTVYITAHDNHGKPIARRKIRNLYLNQGRSFIIKKLGDFAFPGGINNPPLNLIYVGTDGTAATAADTGLGGNVANNTGTASQITTTITDDTLRIVAVINIATSVTLREAGLGFSNVSPNAMISRVTYTAVVMPDNSVITVDWHWQSL